MNDPRPTEAPPALANEPAPPWLEALCSIELRRRLRGLVTTGEALAVLAHGWTGEVAEAVDRFEHALRDAKLTDAVHHDVAFLVGVGQLHDILAEFATLADTASARLPGV
jgi:hypothetical protein